MATTRFEQGGNSVQNSNYDFSTIGEALADDLLREFLSLTGEESAQRNVNGTWQTVDAYYEIQPGDHIVFNRKTGDKGQA